MPKAVKQTKNPAQKELAKLRQALLESEQKIAKRDQVIAAKDQKILYLHERIQVLLMQRFGCKADTVPDTQLGLFNEAESVDEQPATEEPPEPTPVASHTRQKKGRRPLPEDLPRVEVIHDIDDKTCPHDGATLKAIGKDVSEQLDIVPAKVQVIRHIRLKYACPCCESHLVTAKKPPQMLEKSNASAGFLAWLIQGKYQLAMPLYRQSQYLSVLNLDISRATLAQWVIRCGDRVSPLIEQLRTLVNAGPVQQVDETTLQVLKEPDRRAQSKSQMWVQRGGPPDQPLILFHYAASRGAAVLNELIDRDFSGGLQSDGYRGYDAFVATRQITHLGCWAHARRKFVEAAKVQKKKTGVAHMAIAQIAKLYAIEARIKLCSSQERAEARQAQAIPILNELRTWLDKQLERITPSSLTGKALAYLHDQWPKLVRYVESGDYAIDNNAIERAIRPFTIGRKNWMFSDSTAGATASANLYSLIETAKANGIEPYAYLRVLFTELPKTNGEITALLPIAENREKFQLQINA